MKEKLYRQGDLLFREVNQLPEGSEPRKRNNGHIEEGEKTGHIHRLATLEDAEVLEIGNGLFVNVTAEGGVSIVHQEHQPLALPPGNFEVVRQREYTPEAPRPVLD